MLIATDFFEKVHYPLGGMIQIAKALEKLSRAEGVEILTNESVLGVTLKGKTISELVTSKRRLKTEVVINTADYAYFDTKIIPKQYREYSQAYWDSRTYAISSLLIYLGISK